MPVELDLDESLHLEAELHRIDDRGVTGDHALSFELPHAPRAGCAGQSDPLTQFDDGQAAFRLQLRDDAGIQAIEGHGYNNHKKLMEWRLSLRCS